MIDGITLLKKIKNNEIKDNTKINVVYDDGLGPVTKTIITYINEELIWGNGNFKVSMLWDSFYSFEIIEDKSKNIEKLIMQNYNGETVIGANMWSYFYKINELVDVVNYLLKKVNNDSE